MNTIATTYHHALSRGSRESGVWSAIRATLLRLVPAKEAVAARDPIREAAAVREMAHAIHARDPHFAADLYAAADRHEELYAGERAR